VPRAVATLPGDISEAVRRVVREPAKSHGCIPFAQTRCTQGRGFPSENPGRCAAPTECGEAADTAGVRSGKGSPKTRSPGTPGGESLVTRSSLVLALGKIQDLSVKFRIVLFAVLRGAPGTGPGP
jgi:hypothetical protein